MQKERLLYLLNQYKNNLCTNEELQELEEWYQSFDEKEEVITRYETTIFSEQKYNQFIKQLEEKGLTAPVVSVKKYRWLRFSAAAAFIGFLFLGIYLFINHSNKTIIAKSQITASINDVAPGGNKAVLTLADGSTIVLDSVDNGTLSQQGNTKVSKINSGLLQYDADSVSNVITYNTLMTPKGGQYQIVLADGSKVWLNSASSLKYPTAFIGNERTVELTGEAYFEVAKNPSKPFHVKTKMQDVEVLGTHFNINAYDDEASINTTLLEGKVRVVNRQSSIMNLIPGQQAQVSYGTSTIKLIKDVDIDKIMAWKNGWFEFDDTQLPAIMRQVSRWYDVEIAYNGTPTNETFGGRISKNLPLSSVLLSIQNSGVKFKQDGKKLIVQP